MKKYEFHSVLPPEELKKRLIWETAVENEQYKKQFKIALRWKGEREFTFYTVGYNGGSGAYRSAEAGTRGASMDFWAGAGWSAAFSPVFCGQIAPDGAGSVISGHFRQPLWGWAVCIGGVHGLGVISCAVTGRYWIYVIALILGIPMFRDFLFPERTKGAGELWDMLEYLVETVGGFAMEREKSSKSQIEE